jgi:hypothetical protein
VSASYGVPRETVALTNDYRRIPIACIPIACIPIACIPIACILIDRIPIDRRKRRAIGAAPCALPARSPKSRCSKST